MIQDYLWDYPGLFGTHGYVYVVMGSAESEFVER